jgi:hypothetical protein
MLATSGETQAGTQKGSGVQIHARARLMFYDPIVVSLQLPR